MGLIVDTGVFIVLERSGGTAGLGASEGPIFVSSITLSELWVGAHRADNETRRRRRLEFIENFALPCDQLPFTTDTARVHSRLHADLLARGQMIGAHDLLIAATAVEHGLAVLTTNRREFDRIPGLAVVAYPLDPAPGA